MDFSGKTVQQTDHIGYTRSYTPVKVKDKDSGENFIINFTNCKVQGNEASWTIKDGKVVDKNGKTVEDMTIEVTRYQAALIKAAASGDDYGDDAYLDDRDLIGAAYADNAKEALQEAKSEYKLVEDTVNNYGDGYTRYSADALEYGEIFADVENAKGDKGKLNIILEPEYQPPKIEIESKPWWKFW